MFNEKPPMLGGDVARDLAAIRDYLFRMARGLEEVATAAGTGAVVAYGANGQQPAGGAASKNDIEAVKKNASELRDMIVKSADNMQKQIDEIELTTFYVKYADDFTGSYPETMYNTPTVNTVYMGVCSSSSTTAPTNPSAYTWSKVKGNAGPQGPKGEDGEDGAPGKDGADGAQGPQGIPGQPGTNGQTTYLHIKYSDDGQTFTGNQGEDLGAFIGMYTDYTEADSTTFSDYVWHRFADDTELRAMISAGDQAVMSYVDSKSETYNSLYVAKSEYGQFTETINSRIETSARGVIESYNYGSAIESMQDSIDLIQAYFTNITGEIRRGIVQDPSTGDYVTGIAISQNLQFSGECGGDDPNNPGDGYTYYYLTNNQTFGLYTSTGWQFWIDGYKKGWFDSEDGMLHVATIYAEEKIVYSGYWETKNSDINGYHMFEISYIGG